MARVVASCLLASSILLVPLTMRAASPTDADLILAKQYFSLGKTYYEQGSYQRALEAFQQSYKHSNKAALLYNIGRCHETLGQLQAAVDDYRRYLRESGRADATIEAKIGNIEARLAAKEAARKAAPASDVPAAVTPAAAQPTTQPVLPLDVEQLAPDRDAQPKMRPVASEPTARSGSNWMKWTGWGLIGLGTASVVTSFVLGSRAAAKANLVEDAYACPNANDPTSPCGGRPYDWSQIKDSEDAGKAFQVGQIVTLAVGLAAAGGGVAMLLLAGPANTESRTARIAPLLGPETVGLTSELSF